MHAARVAPGASWHRALTRSQAKRGSALGSAEHRPRSTLGFAWSPSFRRARGPTCRARAPSVCARTAARCRTGARSALRRVARRSRRPAAALVPCRAGSTERPARRFGAHRRGGLLDRRLRPCRDVRPAARPSLVDSPATPGARAGAICRRAPRPASRRLRSPSRDHQSLFAIPVDGRVSRGPSGFRDRGRCATSDYVLRYPRMPRRAPDDAPEVTPNDF